jgi:hypothetical protein
MGTIRKRTHTILRWMANGTERRECFVRRLAHLGGKPKQSQGLEEFAARASGNVYGRELKGDGKKAGLI